MKIWVSTALTMALMGCVTANDKEPLPDGMSLINEVMLAPSEVGIEYKKYELSNGLTLVLHQDQSDPLVHVDVTYHVGSARELPGRSGFAHLFEHMMFQGSQHVADEQHFKVVTESGGTLNGTTNSDRTNYFETVPSNQLEKMLWLESDRMGFLLPALTDAKFEVQRETVKNERAQRVDNRPYGRMNERFGQALYPEGHPYSWPVIGWPDDLNRATPDDVRQFFKRWYGPNNATLTIGGDFEEAQVLQWVNQYFADIPSGPEVAAPEKTLVTLDKTRYVSMEDKVHLPLIKVSFPTVYARHEDEAALDILANILGGGKTSLFYKNLVKDGYAVQAGVSHPCQELSCQMSMYALANPARGGKLVEIEQKIQQSIAEFEQRGVTQSDLQKVKIQFEADTIFGLQSVRGKVSTLAFNQTFSGTPDLTSEDLERYRTVTLDDVMRVFKAYIKNKPMVVMSVVPQGATDLIAAENNFIAPKPSVAQVAVQGVAHQKQPLISFDRNIMPASGKAPILNVPKLWHSKLANGIEVIGTQTTETPTVELVIYLKGGHRLVDVEQAGLAQLTAAMLNESSQTRSTEELADALEMLGSSIQFGASQYQSYVKVSSLTSKLTPTLALVEEKLFSPGFKEEDFARIKQQQLQSLQHQQSDANYLARTRFSELLFGAETSLGVSSSGTIDTVSALTLEDIKTFYAKQYRAGNAQIVAVADLGEQAMVKELAGLTAWQGDAVAYTSFKPFPNASKATVYLVDKPGAAQSVISIGKRALAYDVSGDFYKSYLMNYPLGGAFNSRINLNLREDKGYTYGARTGFSGGEETGYFKASASVRTDVTAEAIKEFASELSKYQNKGMTENELAFLQSSISQSQALDYETPYQKAGFLRMIQKYGLSPEFTQKQNAIVNQISVEELNQLANKQLDINQMVILVVGDRATIEKPLVELGYDLVIL